MHKPVKVTGIALISALGLTPDEHEAALTAGVHGLRPLGELPELAGAFAELPGGWISQRSLLAGNRYGPATNCALALASRVVADADLSASEVREAWLFVGSSRGMLPANLPGLTGAGHLFTLPNVPVSCGGDVVLKISVGMGGHNAVMALSRFS